MTEDDKRSFIEYLSYKEDLARLENRGIRLFLDGEPVSAQRLALECTFKGAVPVAGPEDGVSGLYFSGQA